MNYSQRIQMLLAKAPNKIIDPFDVVGLEDWLDYLRATSGVFEAKTEKDREFRRIHKEIKAINKVIIEQYPKLYEKEIYAMTNLSKLDGLSVVYNIDVRVENKPHPDMIDINKIPEPNTQGAKACQEEPKLKKVKKIKI